MRDRTIVRWASKAAALALAASMWLPAPSAAQDGGSDRAEVELGGLLRTGLVAGPADAGVREGFELYDARLRASGEVGIVFDYHVQAEWDGARQELRLLDARLTLPIVPELALELGQFRAPFGKEALKGKGEITFVERARISRLLAPGRQVGAQLSAETVEGKLTFRAGLFNGNGRTVSNDDDRFLWAGRVQFNNLGTSEFYDELVVEVGANAAFSSDSSANLVAGLDHSVQTAPLTGGFVDLEDFRGERLLYGADLRMGWQGFFLRGEYLRGDLEPASTSLVGLTRPEAGEELTVEGAYLEGGYSYLGAIEAVVRWDRVNDAIRTVEGQPVNPEDPTGGSDFLVFGLNLFPGYHAKMGLQYATGLGGTELGPGLADGEFALLAQVDF